MRITVAQRAFESFPAKHDHKAMTFTGPDDHLDIADLLDFASEQCTLRFTDFGVDAAGATIGHDPLRVERTKIGARGDVTVLQVDAQSERLNDPATNLELKGVVTK